MSTRRGLARLNRPMAIDIGQFCGIITARRKPSGYQLVSRRPAARTIRNVASVIMTDCVSITCTRAFLNPGAHGQNKIACKHR